MATAEFMQILLVVAVAFATAAVTLAGAAALASRRAPPALRAALEEAAMPAFLFDAGHLVDATPAGRKLMAAANADGSDWARLAAILRHRFRGLDEAIASLADTGRVELVASDGSEARLRAEWRGGLAWVELVEDAARGAEEDAAEHLTRKVLQAEVETLRAISAAGPTAIWKLDAEGDVIWANDIYFALAAELAGSRGPVPWPPPAIFPLTGAFAAEPGRRPTATRISLRSEDGRRTRWFECYGYDVGGSTICTAVPADALVHAEDSLREFVGTLTRTFADLPIGLAVFDRSRRLTVFNPALTDLTALDVTFLAARPTLFAFLDALRDRRRIPEPRDYRSWRQRIVDLEAAAATGHVQEDWSLPGGQTYRVTGRPHPDGALAFLFEDISAEVSLTRRFRSEIEIGQTVIDSLEEAIAVFSPGGILTFSNSAYAALWGVDPASSLVQTGVAEATRLWSARAQPTPVWGDLRDFIVERGDRAEWFDTVTLTDGRVMNCRFQPLSGGATLVGFSIATATPRGAGIEHPRGSTARPATRTAAQA